MLIRRATPLSLFLLFLFSACHKEADNPEGAGGTRLHMITIFEKEPSERTDYLVFGYDSLGRLASYVDSLRFRSDPGSFVSTVFPTTQLYYDSQGRVSKLVARERISDFADAVYDLWFYNNEGLVSKRIFIAELESDTTTHTYGYDQTRHVIADSIFKGTSGELSAFTTYQYDGRDNIVEWVCYSVSSGNVKQEWKANATYDDHPNPLAAVGLFKLPYGSDISGLSRNNLLAATYSTGVTEQHQYLYYNEGLPKADHYQLSGIRSMARSNNYFYE